MKNRISDALQVIAAILITGGLVASAAPLPTTPSQASTTPEVTAKVETPATPVKPETKPVEAPQTVATPTVAQEPVVEAQPVSAPVQTTSASDNESIVWNYLIASGFSRNQTAGIMGNLQQEHGFQTSGDGLAQWLGGRRANLLSKANPYDINTQVAFLVEELNGPYAGVKGMIQATDNLESVVIIFQNKFEVCNPYYCMQAQRIAYAYDILNRH